jgi:hypothetical protein
MAQFQYFPLVRNASAGFKSAAGDRHVVAGCWQPGNLVERNGIERTHNQQSV